VIAAGLHRHVTAGDLHRRDVCTPAGLQRLVAFLSAALAAAGGDFVSRDQ